MYVCIVYPYSYIHLAFFFYKSFQLNLPLTNAKYSKVKDCELWNVKWISVGAHWGIRFSYLGMCATPSCNSPHTGVAQNLCGAQSTPQCTKHTLVNCKSMWSTTILKSSIFAQLFSYLHKMCNRIAHPHWSKPLQSTKSARTHFRCAFAFASSHNCKNLLSVHL